MFAAIDGLGYRPLTSLFRVQGTVDFLRKREGWGEMPRRGLETERPTPAEIPAPSLDPKPPTQETKR